MFYNVENYFDIKDDSTKLDNEFLPESDKHWDYYRYREKSMNIYKVIAAVGEKKAPDIVCFAEIENSYVLNELIYETPLGKIAYRKIHYESPDIRGIDVGLIYNPATIRLIKSRPIAVNFPQDSRIKTRDILYLKALLANDDTLHLFVNHWPSRRGGEEKSEPNRMYAATTLRLVVDSILASNCSANIVITGDFNDEPNNNSIVQALGADPDKPEQSQCETLYNLSGILQQNCKCGSYRYKNDWNMIDQFIVSGSLLDMKSKTQTCQECAQLAEFDFLLMEDKTYGGFKPKRTYQGPSYKGGYSDHLPIYLDIFFQ